MNEYIMAHIIMYARNSAPPCMEVGGRGLRGLVGVGWCACDKTNTVNHVHAHLVGFGGVCRGSVHYAQCFGPVNGHDTNLRDRCGVCDDVTG